ncbi:MAG: winged helix-turn-helix domain-containing protein, partial [Psychrosphaera sp.]|nr:winged helix-turn-helix domain-containing protein [Psychrosphaera sp.]
MPAIQKRSAVKPFFINDYQVIPSKNIIICQGEPVSVTPKMMAVLLVLYQANREAVTKQALLDSVWSDVVVSDLILSRAVTDLRKVFNETAKNAMVIKTIPKVGYCMGSTNVYITPDEKIGPNEKTSPNESAAPDQNTPTDEKRAPATKTAEV